jgi:hypothetical protein
MIREGDTVEAHCKGSAKYYQGKVRAVNRDGTYNVAFEDGDRDKMVPKRSIKKLGGGGGGSRGRVEKFEEDDDPEFLTAAQHRRRGFGQQVFTAKASPGQAWAEGLCSILMCKCSEAGRELRGDWDDLNDVEKNRRSGQWTVLALPICLAFFVLWVLNKVRGIFAESESARLIASEGPLALVLSGRSRTPDYSGDINITVMCEAHGFEFEPYYILLAQVVWMHVCMGNSDNSKPKATRVDLTYLLYQVICGSANIVSVYLRFLSGDKASPSAWASYQMFALLLSQSSGFTSGVQLFVNGNIIRLAVGWAQEGAVEAGRIVQASVADDSACSSIADEGPILILPVDALRSALLAEDRLAGTAANDGALATGGNKAGGAEAAAEVVEVDTVDTVDTEEVDTVITEEVIKVDTKDTEDTEDTEDTKEGLLHKYYQWLVHSACYQWLFEEQTSWDKAVTCDAAATVLVLPMASVFLTHSIPMAVCYIWVWMLAGIGAGIAGALCKALAEAAFALACGSKKAVESDEDRGRLLQIKQIANHKITYTVMAVLWANSSVAFGIIWYSGARGYIDVIATDFELRNGLNFYSCTGAKVLSATRDEWSSLTQFLSRF